MTWHFLNFIDFGFLCGKQGFEVRPDLQKLFSFLPFLDIFVPIMLTLALHDPFGEVEILPVNFELSLGMFTLRR